MPLGQWTELASPPIPVLSGSGQHFTLVGYKDGVFGFDADDSKTLRYDPVTDTWTQIGVSSIWGDTERIGNLLYFPQGFADPAAAMNLRVYDMDTDTWNESLTPGPYATSSPSISSDGERIYVYGGRSGFESGPAASPIKNPFRRYVIATDTWESAPGVGMNHLNNFWWSGSGISDPETFSMNYGHQAGVAVYTDGFYYCWAGQVAAGAGNVAGIGRVGRIDVATDFGQTAFTDTWATGSNTRAPGALFRTKSEGPVIISGPIFQSGGGLNNTVRKLVLNTGTVTTLPALPDAVRCVLNNIAGGTDLKGDYYCFGKDTFTDVARFFRYEAYAPGDIVIPAEEGWGIVL